VCLLQFQAATAHGVCLLRFRLGRHTEFGYKDPEPTASADDETTQVQAMVLAGGRVEVGSPDLLVGRSVSVTITVPGAAAG
jgi:hypothetical protein